MYSEYRWLEKVNTCPFGLKISPDLKKLSFFEGEFFSIFANNVTFRWKFEHCAFQRNSETNDVLFKSNDKELLESWKKLGVVSYQMA